MTEKMTQKMTLSEEQLHDKEKEKKQLLAGRFQNGLQGMMGNSFLFFHFLHIQLTIS